MKIATSTTKHSVAQRRPETPIRRGAPASGGPSSNRTSRTSSRARPTATDRMSFRPTNSWQISEILAFHTRHRRHRRPRRRLTTFRHRHPTKTSGAPLACYRARRPNNRRHGAGNGTMRPTRPRCKPCTLRCRTHTTVDFGPRLRCMAMSLRKMLAVAASRHHLHRHHPLRHRDPLLHRHHHHRHYPLPLRGPSAPKRRLATPTVSSFTCSKTRRVNGPRCSMRGINACSPVSRILADGPMHVAAFQPFGGAVPHTPPSFGEKSRGPWPQMTTNWWPCRSTTSARRASTMPLGCATRSPIPQRAG